MTQGVLPFITKTKSTEVEMQLQRERTLQQNTRMVRVANRWYGDSDEVIILFQRSNRKVVLVTHCGRFFYG